jgi:hypothetical protein
MNEREKLLIQKAVFQEVSYKLQEIATEDAMDVVTLDRLHIWSQECHVKILKKISSIDSYEEIKNKLISKHGWDKIPAISTERN